MVSDLGPYLAEHPILEGMRPEHIQLMVGCAENVRFHPEEYLFREGEKSDRFYFLRHGKVSLELYHPKGGGAMVVQTLGEGDVIGWSWLFPPHYRNLDGRATELVRAIALDGACLRGKCEADHELGYEIMKRFAHLMEKELQAMQLRLLDMYAPTH